MADNYFCLDIGEKFVKVADVKNQNDSLEISFLGKIDTVANFFTSELEKTLDDQAKAINRILNTSKITKKNVNVIIPDSFTYNQILTMPALNEKELISAIKYQADQFIPMPIEETNIDLEIIEEYKQEKQLLILIVAAPKKLIEKIQTTIELAGLIPESIETELSANARLIEMFNKKLSAQAKTNFLMVNFGINSTNLSYFEQSKPTLKESHNIALGFQLFLKEIRINTDTSDIQALDLLKNYSSKQTSSYPIATIIAPLLREFANEIKRFTSVNKVGNIYLINNVANFPGLAQMLQEQTSISCSVLNPLPFINKSAIVESLKPELPFFISTIGGNLR